MQLSADLMDLSNSRAATNAHTSLSSGKSQVSTGISYWYAAFQRSSDSMFLTYIACMSVYHTVQHACTLCTDGTCSSVPLRAEAVKIVFVSTDSTLVCTALAE